MQVCLSVCTHVCFRQILRWQNRKEHARNRNISCDNGKNCCFKVLTTNCKCHHYFNVKWENGICTVSDRLMEDICINTHTPYIYVYKHTSRRQGRRERELVTPERKSRCESKQLSRLANPTYDKVAT